MMKGYSISIVIPAYNAEKFITVCLDSVKQQTYSDYEVIVVNDGSTDSTEQVILEYKKDFPQIPLNYIYQQNKGAAGARNAGVEAAKMDLIAFLDADDIWYPKKLEKVVDVFKKNQVDVVYHDEYEIDLCGRKRVSRYRALSENSMEDLIINGNALSTSTVVVKTELVKKFNTFKNEKRAGEDIECWIELARNGARFYHLPAILGEYRRVETSLTLKSVQYMKETDKMALEYYELLDHNKYSKEQIEMLKNIRRGYSEYKIGRYYHRNGEFSQAISYYKKALSFNRQNRKAVAGIIMSCLHIKK